MEIASLRRTHQRLPCTFHFDPSRAAVYCSFRSANLHQSDVTIGCFRTDASGQTLANDISQAALRAHASSDDLQVQASASHLEPYRLRDIRNVHIAMARRHIDWPRNASNHYLAAFQYRCDGSPVRYFQAISDFHFLSESVWNLPELELVARLLDNDCGLQVTVAICRISRDLGCDRNRNLTFTAVNNLQVRVRQLERQRQRLRVADCDHAVEFRSVLCCAERHGSKQQHCTPSQDSHC